MNDAPAQNPETVAEEVIRFDKPHETHAAIHAIRRELLAIFPEREHVIDGALYSVLAGEHVLLIGPPGTAKSALARVFARAFGGRYFERALTGYSTPDELFGPTSLRALEQDRSARVTTGKLPECEFAFIDEIFKANSAILNSLLTIMNERLFHNDGAPVHAPLVTMFGASNELPDDGKLEALFDRFLVRFDVQCLAQHANFEKMLLAPDPSGTVSITLEGLRQAQAEVNAVHLTSVTVGALSEIKNALKAEGIIASDRRWKKLLRLAKASAWMEGQTETSTEDLMFLTDALWRQPSERTKISRVVGHHSDPYTSRCNEIVTAALETLSKIESLKNNGTVPSFLAGTATGLEDFNKQIGKIVSLRDKAGPRARPKIEACLTSVRALHDKVKEMFMVTPSFSQGAVYASRNPTEDEIPL